MWCEGVDYRCGVRGWTDRCGVRGWTIDVV